MFSPAPSAPSPITGPPVDASHSGGSCLLFLRKHAYKNVFLRESFRVCVSWRTGLKQDPSTLKMAQWGRGMCSLDTLPVEGWLHPSGELLHLPELWLPHMYSGNTNISTWQACSEGKQTMCRVCLPVRGAFSPSENLPLRTEKEPPFIRVTVRGVSEALWQALRLTWFPGNSQLPPAVCLHTGVTTASHFLPHLFPPLWGLPADAAILLWGPFSAHTERPWGGGSSSSPRANTGPRETGGVNSSPSPYPCQEAVVRPLGGCLERWCPWSPWYQQGCSSGRHPISAAARRPAPACGSLIDWQLEGFAFCGTWTETLEDSFPLFWQSTDWDGQIVLRQCSAISCSLECYKGCLTQWIFSKGGRFNTDIVINLYYLRIIQI